MCWQEFFLLVEREFTVTMGLCVFTLSGDSQEIPLIDFLVCADGIYIPESLLQVVECLQEG